METLSTNPRIPVGLVDLEDKVRAEVKNWSTPSVKPRDSLETNNPSTIPKQTKASILSISQDLEVPSVQPKATLVTMVSEDRLATMAIMDLEDLLAEHQLRAQEDLVQRLEVK